MTKRRIDELDVLRALSFLSIVMQHVIGDIFYRNDIYETDKNIIILLYQFTRFATPTFVFMTAVLLFYKYKDIELPSYFSFIKSRLTIVFVPYMIWNLFYILYNYYTFDLFPLELNVIVEQLYNPTYGYHLWFVIMIFQFYLLFPLFLSFVRWMNQNRTRLLFSFLFVTLLYIIYLWFSYEYLPTHFNEFPVWFQEVMRYRTLYFISYFFYFIAAGVIAFHLDTFRIFVKNVKPYIILFFIFFYVLITKEMFETSNLQAASYLRPFTFIYIILEFIVLYRISLFIAFNKLKITRLFKKMFKQISKYSYGGYLSHALVIFVVVRVYNSLPIDNKNHFYAETTIILFLIVALISILLPYVLSKTPLSLYLTGRKRMKHKGTDSFEKQIDVGK